MKHVVISVKSIQFSVFVIDHYDISIVTSVKRVFSRGNKRNYSKWIILYKNITPRFVSSLNEYSFDVFRFQTTSSEDIRDFFRIFKNKFWSKHRKSPKLGYLPLPHVFDNTLSTNDSQTSSSPILMPSSTLEPVRTDDEHGIIAQHCRNLNHGTLPTVCFHERIE